MTDSPTVEIVGAPFDLCGMRVGSRLGPAALRLAGLTETLQGLAIPVRDRGDLTLPLVTAPNEPLRHFPSLLASIEALRSATLDAFAEEAFPLVLGGEHTLSMASVSAALTHTGGDLAVLWIDAHADVNTPGSSETGNIHGMPLAALSSLRAESPVAESQWEALLSALGSVKLDPSAVAWFGLRDVDRAETPRMAGLPITMHEIDRHGVEACLDRFFAWLGTTGKSNLWISFDVDSLDPFLAPGTGTAVRGGLTYREAHLLAELLSERLGSSRARLIGLDVMETNPIYDQNNGTAIVAVEWIASLFGKRVLGGGASPIRP